MDSLRARKVAIYVVVAGCVLLVPLMVPNPYLLHVIVLSLMYAILATSLNLVTGYSGLLSLGHQAFFGIGAYTSALLCVDLNIPVPLAMLVGGMAAAIGALGIGSITLRFRSAYFVISTIAFAEMLRIVCLNWYSLTRGPLGIANIPPLSLGQFSIDTPAKAYYLVLFLLVLSIVVTWRIVHSHLGRVLVGLRDAEYVAKSVGIDPTKHLLLSVVVSGFMAGLAGSFYAHYVKFLSPDVLYFSVAVNMIIMVVGGGMGTIEGPVLGAFLFTFLPELLRSSAEYRLIIYGLLLVIIVRFLPGGVWSLVLMCKSKLSSIQPARIGNHGDNGVIATEGELGSGYSQGPKHRD
ncbi:branched-chain amino acid ABC transporter permease [Moorellaceae bacterium AZ2]